MSSIPQRTYMVSYTQALWCIIKNIDAIAYSGYNGLSIPSQFMNDTLNANNFPITIYLPDGNIFVAANQQAMIFNWKTNTETRLPNIPNGVRIAYV